MQTLLLTRLSHPAQQPLKVAALLRQSCLLLGSLSHGSPVHRAALGSRRLVSMPSHGRAARLQAELPKISSRLLHRRHGSPVHWAALCSQSMPSHGRAAHLQATLRSISSRLLQRHQGRLPRSQHSLPHSMRMNQGQHQATLQIRVGRSKGVLRGGMHMQGLNLQHKPRITCMSPLSRNLLHQDKRHRQASGAAQQGTPASLGLLTPQRQTSGASRTLKTPRVACSGMFPCSIPAMQMERARPSRRQAF